jgi:hypothetical protein
MSRRTRAIAALGMAAALLLPLAAASADTGGPPQSSGRSFATTTQPLCDATSCTTVEFTAQEFDDSGPAVCVDTITTTLDGTTVLEQEDGCNFDSHGAWRVIGGYITGVEDTTVHLDSTLGTSRDAVVSAKTALAGEATATIEKLDGSDQNCTITWTVKVRTIPVAGTVTIDGVVYTTSSDTESLIRNVKEKSSC